MQVLAGIAALVLTGVGFSRGGLLGALTGVVVSIAVGSGFAIAQAESGTNIDADPGVRRVQRVGGLIAAILCLVAAIHGGWRWGWAWSFGGYLAAMVMIAGLGAVLSKKG